METRVNPDQVSHIAICDTKNSYFETVEETRALSFIKI